MTSIIKILRRLVPLGILLLTAIVYHSSNNSGYADNTERHAVELQKIRRRRAATIHHCKFNQYYDQEEGRCLGVPGGGKVLHVENGRSCGTNVLKPHCKSSLYYHICKRDKSILAQCANSQIFDNRLQRCVYYDSKKLTPDIIPPDNYMNYNHVRVPRCTRSGRFPLHGHCSMFYTCDTNGHRFFQSVFKCPRNMGYQVDRGICNIVRDCLNNNSVHTICVPNAPNENVESLNLDEAVERNVKETPEIFEESKILADDSVTESEKNVNSMIFEDIITTTPGSVISTLLKNNYNDNDSNVDVSSDKANSSKSIGEVSVPDGIDEEIMHSQVPNLPETVQKISDEGQNEENGSSSLLGLRITSPLTTEFDDASHSIMTSMTSIKPEYRTNPDGDSEATDSTPFSSSSYILSKLSEGIQGVTTEQYKNIEDSTMMPLNFNTEAIDSTSTISNAPEYPSISDVSFKTNEKTQDDITEQYKNNEDSIVTPSNLNTDLIDLPSTPVINNVPESSPISDVSPNIDEKMQDMPTEQDTNNENNPIIPSNFNTDSIDSYSTPTVSDVPESSTISDVPPIINEKLQDAPVEQYTNTEDSAITPPNFNTDSIDSYSAPTVSDIPEPSPISDVSPNINEKLQDAPTEQYTNNEDSAVIPSNFNTDSVDPYSTPAVSDVSEPSPISDVSPNIDEKMQDMPTEQDTNNENNPIIPSNFNTDSIDSYSTPTVSDVPEPSPISDVSPNINEKLQDAPTEQYTNNEDSAITPPNFNTDSIDSYSAPTVSDIPEPSPISDVSPNINEKLQDAPTEQYTNNEDSAITPPNFNTDSIDSYSAPTVSDASESSPIDNTSSKLNEEIQNVPTEMYSTGAVDPNLTSALKDIPAITDSTKNDDFDALSSTSTPAISPSQAAIDELTTERLLETTPSIDSKLTDPNLSIPDEVENISTRYSPENTDDDLYLTPTTGSTLISKEITAPVDIATTIPPIQDPSISDTDLVMQNGKDSTEASAFTE